MPWTYAIIGLIIGTIIGIVISRITTPQYQKQKEMQKELEDAFPTMDIKFFENILFKNLVNASLLAVPGLIFCTFVTGFALLGL